MQLNTMSTVLKARLHDITQKRECKVLKSKKSSWLSYFDLAAIEALCCDERLVGRGGCSLRMQARHGVGRRRERHESRNSLPP